MRKLLFIALFALPLAGQFANGTLANGTFFGGTLPNTITLVDQNAAGGGTCVATSGSSIPCALTGPDSSGDKLFLLYGGNPVGNNITGITGCAATWTLAIRSSNNRDASVWYCSNATGGDTTFTATTSGTCGNCYTSISRWTGLSGTLDQTAPSNGTAAIIATGSITTTSANEVIFAVLRDANAGVLVSGPTNSFTPLNNSDSNDGAEFAYRIVSSTGTYSTGWTIAGVAVYDTAIASFH